MGGRGTDQVLDWLYHFRPNVMLLIGAPRRHLAVPRFLRQLVVLELSIIHSLALERCGLVVTGDEHGVFYLFVVFAGEFGDGNRHYLELRMCFTSSSLILLFLNTLIRIRALGPINNLSTS